MSRDSDHFLSRKSTCASNDFYSFAPAFDELSGEDRFGVFWITAIVLDICLHNARRQQQPQYDSTTSRADGRSLLLTFFTDTESPAQLTPAKRRNTNEDAVPVSHSTSYKSAESDDSIRYRPMLLATVTNQMLNRVAVGFISMTTSRFVARAPPYTSSGSMARGCFASLILKRVFGGPLRNLVLHGIRSNFGRMLQMQSIPESMRDLQRAASTKSNRKSRWYLYHSMDAEHAELCVLAQPNVAFNLALNPRAPTFSSHFSRSSSYNRCSDQEARQQSQQLSTIQLLLQYRANVNAKAKECGNTALMDAAFEGCESAVLLLLQHQADVNALEFVYDYNYEKKG